MADLDAICHVTLPASCKLFSRSICPSMDIVVVAAVEGGKLWCYRMNGGEQVWTWEWESQKGNIAQVEWSPDGFLLAVVLHFRTSSPTLFLLSSHTGRLLHAPWKLPDDSTESTFESIQQLRWADLIDTPAELSPEEEEGLSKEEAEEKQIKRTMKRQRRELANSEKIIEQLPEMLTFEATSVRTDPITGALMGYMPPTKKNQTNHEPQHQEINVPSYTAWKTNENVTSTLLSHLPKDTQPISPLPSFPSRTTPPTILFLVTNKKVHILYTGTIYIGSFPSSNQDSSSQSEVIKALSLLQANEEQLEAVVLSEIDDGKETQNKLVKWKIPLPFSLRRTSMTCDTLSRTFLLCLDSTAMLLDGLTQAEKLKEVWIVKLQRLSDSHDEKLSSRGQFMKLLMTNKFTFPLQDFFSSKASERSINQWWQAYNTTLEQMLSFCYRCLTPTLERVIIILEELLHEQKWFQSPFAEMLEHSEYFHFDIPKLERSVKICRLIILLSLRLEKAVIQEINIQREALIFFKYYFIKVENPNENDAVRPEFNVASVRSFIDDSFVVDRKTAIINFFCKNEVFDEKTLNDFDPFWTEVDDDLKTAMERVTAWVEKKEIEIYDPYDPPPSREVVTPNVGILDSLWALVSWCSDLYTEQLQTVAKRAVKEKERLLAHLDGEHFKPGYNGVFWSGESIIILENGRTQMSFPRDNYPTLKQPIDWGWFHPNIRLLLLYVDGSQALCGFGLGRSRVYNLDNPYEPEALAANSENGRNLACTIGGNGRKMECWDLDALWNLIMFGIEEFEDTEMDIKMEDG